MPPLPPPLTSPHPRALAGASTHGYAKSSTAKILNSFASLSQTAKFFNAFELFAYYLMTSTAYWQRRLADNHNNKQGTLAKLIFLYDTII